MKQDNEQQGGAKPMEGELMQRPDSGALAVIARAEIDSQVATAKQYPRSMQAFKKMALELVSLDEETAESCIYSRPVGKKKDESGKWVQAFAEGMSVRMAEIVGACYGNLRVGARIVEITDRFVRAQGVARDLQTNFESNAEAIESTVDSAGNPYSERMRMVVAKAALAKARRDATFQVVPRALCRSLEIEAKRIAVGDATTLEKRRAAVMSWIGKLGIDVGRVFNALGVKGEADIGLEELTTLTGVKTAIKDGELKVDEAFPPLDGEAPAGATLGTSGLKDKLAKAAPKAGDPKPAAEGAKTAPEAQAPAGAPAPGLTAASPLTAWQKAITAAVTGAEKNAVIAAAQERGMTKADVRALDSQATDELFQ